MIAKPTTHDTLAAHVIDGDLSAEQIATVLGIPVELVHGWFDGYENIGILCDHDTTDVGAATYANYAAGYRAGQLARAAMNRSAAA